LLKIPDICTRVFRLPAALYHAASFSRSGRKGGKASRQELNPERRRLPTRVLKTETALHRGDVGPLKGKREKERVLILGRLGGKSEGLGCARLRRGASGWLIGGREIQLRGKGTAAESSSASKGSDTKKASGNNLGVWSRKAPKRRGGLFEHQENGERDVNLSSYVALAVGAG